MLGVDTLKYYDLYAPAVKEVDLKYKYDEASKIILEALKPLGEDYITIIKKAIDNRWIDVFPEREYRHSLKKVLTDVKADANLQSKNCETGMKVNLYHTYYFLVVIKTETRLEIQNQKSTEELLLSLSVYLNRKSTNQRCRTQNT